jgi:hypothetical protein
MGQKNDKKPNKIAGVKIGGKLGAGEIRQIQEAKPNISIAAIKTKAKDADVKIKSAARSVFNAEAQRLADAAKEEEKRRQTEHLTELGILNESGQTIYGSASSNLPGQQVASVLDVELAKEGSNLATQKEIERIRDAGATERLKYEVDNRIPEIQAESKGKLDLQAIVNAGYKNIANIERGSDMVRNITSMFNF